MTLLHCQAEVVYEGIKFVVYRLSYVIFYPIINLFVFIVTWLKLICHSTSTTNLN